LQPQGGFRFAASGLRALTLEANGSAAQPAALSRRLHTQQQSQGRNMGLLLGLSNAIKNLLINAHPRVDSYTETLNFRARAWIEFWGCLLFALPYSLLLVQHGWDFFWTSYLQNERSENAVGLEHRWLIKGVFYIGLWLLLAGIVSVVLRLIVFLFGRRPQSEVELQIGHAELEV
jgi:TRAP-type mannitol/chloroaromatic compound transport system permease small subunit